MDEAHRTVGRKDKTFAHLLSDENIEIDKRIFMTATERQFIGSSDDIVSMDDTDVYGEIFELLTFKEAIEADDPIICDYKFVTIEIREDEIRELWQENKFLRIGSDDLDEVTTRSLAAGLALRKAYTDFNIKRAISFHGSIKKASNFTKQQEAITEVFPELAEVECFHVSSKVPTGKRTSTLHAFAKSERGLITNARCLTEGVDIPTVDCVLFSDPRRSVIDIVQAAGRAMRKAPGKKYGYILVPMVVPSDVADPDEFAKSTQFKEIVRTIRPLAINDNRIIDYFRAISQGHLPKNGSPVLFESNIKQAASIDGETFNESISLIIWEKLAKIGFPPLGQFMEEVRAAGGFTSTNDYQERRELHWPSNPDKYYGIKMSDITGNTASYKRKFPSLNQFILEVKKARIESRSDYYKKRLPHWHSLPTKYYGISWKVLTGNSSPQNAYQGILTKEEFFAAVKKCGVIRNRKDYRNMREKYPEWPGDPLKAYGINWSDITGNSATYNTEFPQVEQFLRECKEDGIKSVSDYKNRRRESWPSNPTRTYKPLTFAEITGNIASQRIEFPSLEKLLLEMKEDGITVWSDYKENRRSTWPSQPGKIYGMKWSEIMKIYRDRL